MVYDKLSSKTNTIWPINLIQLPLPVYIYFQYKNGVMWQAGSRNVAYEIMLWFDTIIYFDVPKRLALGSQKIRLVHPHHLNVDAIFTKIDSVENGWTINRRATDFITELGLQNQLLDIHRTYGSGIRT